MILFRPPTFAQCSHPFTGGLSLPDVCPGSQMFLFLSLLNSIISRDSNIGDPCGRIQPVRNPSKTYDFIVVGGGTAGSVVASRLSEVPEWNVLLLEAGPDEPAGAQIPSNLQAFLNSPLDWNYETTDEKHACLVQGGKCRWPRGKNLGGCSVHHGMAYHRGNAKDYANWEALGNKGWSWEKVLPYFLLSEDNTEIDRVGRKHHATGGPLPVGRFRSQPQFAWDILKAGDELGYGITEDVVGDKITGFSVVQTNSRNGVRVSNAAAFLRPVKHRKNLHVAINAMATKIIVENQRAVGVEYIIDGKLTEARANGEVIVTAGAVNSPQLLLLSGIGPKEQLQRLGVPVVLNLPGVGENVHNHVSYGLDFTLDEPDESELNIKTATEYLHSQTGPLSSTGIAQVTAILASKYTTPDYPDIQLFFAGYQAVCPSNAGVSDLHSQSGKRSVRFTAVNLRVRSRGNIRLASADPLVNPAILSNDLTDPRDVAILVEAIKVILNVASNSTIMKRHSLTLVSTPLEQCSQYEFKSDEYWACAVHQDTRTENHQAGSCKMGTPSDKLAVVDNKLRVYGIKGLRVADASIMPQVISGNPAGPITMIGERVSDFIKNYWGARTRIRM